MPPLFPHDRLELRTAVEAADPSTAFRAKIVKEVTFLRLLSGEYGAARDGSIERIEAATL
jgi:hypothetical protein